jgi:geranylgeranyl pyrophosphate synthase
MTAPLALAAITRGGAFGRVAAELGPELDEIGEDVGLAAQLVGDHRRLAGDGGDRGDPHAAALDGLDQGTEVAVAREQHHPIDVLGSSMASTASSMSMLPLTLRRPEASMDALDALVTTV